MVKHHKVRWMCILVNEHGPRFKMCRANTRSSFMAAVSKGREIFGKTIFAFQGLI